MPRKKSVPEEQDGLDQSLQEQSEEVRTENHGPEVPADGQDLFEVSPEVSQFPESLEDGVHDLADGEGVEGPPVEEGPAAAEETAPEPDDADEFLNCEDAPTNANEGSAWSEADDALPYPTEQQEDDVDGLAEADDDAASAADAEEPGGEIEASGSEKEFEDTLAESQRTDGGTQHDAADALPRDAEASDNSAAEEPTGEPSKAPKRRARKAAAESAEPAEMAEPVQKPRTRRRSTASAEPAGQTEEPAAAKPAQPRRRRGVEQARTQVLSIDDESKVQTAEDKEAYIWMEFRGSLRTKRPLTGVLGGVERTPTGVPLAIVYYKDMRVVIPASEMNINLADHAESSEKDLNNRYAQILSWMMGAEIEFTVSGIDKRAGSVVASRRDAMQRKQKHFFLSPGRNGQPLVQEGITAEARVVAVSERVVRVEVFGVETPIFAREVAWEWVDDCNDYYGIGDRVLVKILSIDRSDPRNIHLRASIRETAPNPARENIKKCVVQGKYIGKVSDVDRNAIYVRLNVGVNAIALAVHDRRTPCRKDDVSFVVTRIDEDAGIAIGIITRIIKQYL